MQHAYSWYGSRIHLVLEDDVADAYNRYLNEFMQAQLRHKERTGSEWNPREPLLMKVNKQDSEVYGKIGDIINQLVELGGGGLDIPEEECTFDGLLKLD